MNVDTVPQLMAALKALQDREVLVGVPAEKDDRQPDKNGKTPAINNATLVYIQNEGSPARGIPAREFMQSGVASKEDQIVSALQRGGKGALNGDIAAVEKAFMDAGQKAVDGIRRKIVDGPFQELAPSTLAARKRAGFKGTKPLNVTGQMRNAITYTVREKRNRNALGQFAPTPSGLPNFRLKGS